MAGQQHDRRNGDVFRITAARTGLTEDVRGRQRRYVLSMLVRTVCVVLAVVLWDVERHVAWAALAAGVLLPYFAVIIANAGRENAPGLPGTFVRGTFRPMLADSPADDRTQEGRAADAAADAGARPHRSDQAVPGS